MAIKEIRSNNRSASLLSGRVPVATLDVTATVRAVTNPADAMLTYSSESGPMSMEGTSDTSFRTPL